MVQIMISWFYAPEYNNNYANQGFFYRKKHEKM